MNKLPDSTYCPILVQKWCYIQIFILSIGFFFRIEKLQKQKTEKYKDGSELRVLNPILCVG